MSDLPSLEDLLQKKDDGPSQDPPQGSSEIATKITTGSKFTKKMGEIKKKELETDAIRKATQSGVPHIDLAKFPISQEALRQIPKERAEEIKAICFFSNQDEVRIGALDPTKQEVQDLFQEIMDRNESRGKLYLISKSSLDRVIKLYETLPTIKPITKDIEIKAEDLEKVQATVNDFESLQSLISGGSTSDLVGILMGAGLKLDASDVHIEAERDKIVVRLRLDGILHDAATLPKELFKRLISRIKLISSLKINIIDKPQDGRFSIRLADGDVDVRVSTMPTVYGESVVMRLLKQSQEGLQLDALGISKRAFDLLSREIARPNGMIITTGPTGSGKTTTLYSVLKILNKPGVKIITLEDPVEYRLEGINQSQIDRKKEYTFARGLRSILRQDPDIVMVGEIRDLETANIAVQAALTGHLMLSTIHTNTASGAIPRFLSIGVKPFLLGPALNCLIGQRLVRKICTSCKKEVRLDDIKNENYKAEVHRLLEALPEEEKQAIAQKDLTFYTSEGCDECNKIGFKGRAGIYEVFSITPEIEDMIASKVVSEHEIEKAAVANGMITMVQDGVLKALGGITSLEEVFRVIE